MTVDESFGSLPRFARWVLGALGLLTAATVAVVAWAARFGPTKASAWFTGVAVILGLAALIAGTLAAVFTLPGYLEWSRAQRARAEVAMWIEVEVDGEWTRGDAGDVIELPHRMRYEVSVVISSTGDRALHGATLNICVPAWCDITPNDPLVKGHYKIPRVGPSALIQPDQGVVPIRYTAAEREVIGKQDLVYSVLIHTNRGAPEIPILASLGGEGLEAQMNVRVELRREVPPPAG